MSKISKPIGFKLTNTKENITAGKTKLALNNWTKITQDKWILDTICGYKIETDYNPKQFKVPRQYQFPKPEEDAITVEIERFLTKNIIEEIPNITEKGEFISNIFFRLKCNGDTRIILNLKLFNERFVNKHHFKMETLNTAITLMRPNCWFASVDLADAYYSIPVHPDDRKLLRFCFKDKKYQFTALVMGLSSSPRVFTKLLKPVYSHLRVQGFISTAYIDDSCLQNDSEEKCKTNIKTTVQLLDSLGFTINLEKSKLQPTQEITFLGFVLCSVSMTIKLTEARRTELIQLCENQLHNSREKIRVFAKLIGKLVAAEPGVKHAVLYTKPLEKVKEQALKTYKGNFDAIFKIPNTIFPIIQ